MLTTDTDKLEISAGIKIPEVLHERGKRSKVAMQLRTMKVGDSFPCETEGEAKRLVALGYTMGMKMCRRKMPEGYRVWYLE